MFAQESIEISTQVFVGFGVVGFGAVLAGIGALFNRLRKIEIGLAVDSTEKAGKLAALSDKVDHLETEVGGLHTEVGKVHARIDVVIGQRRKDDHQ